jgi:pimeloyl-ACP methyl ester carboxylesterase
VAWGRHDPLFTVAGAWAYRREVPDAEVHLLDAGHFALDVEADAIAALVDRFLEGPAQLYGAPPSRPSA